MSPAQARSARASLGWSEADLAAKAGIDERLVRDFEGGFNDPPSGQIEALRSALRAAGAVFTDGPPGGAPPGTGGGVDEGTRLGALTTENDR